MTKQEQLKDIIGCIGYSLGAVGVFYLGFVMISATFCELELERACNDVPPVFRFLNK